MFDAEYGNDTPVNVKTRKHFLVIEHGDHECMRFLVAATPFPVRGREVQSLEDDDDGVLMGPEEGPSIEEEGDIFESPAEAAPPNTDGADEGHLVNREGVANKEPEIDIMQADIREEARKAKGVGIQGQ